MNYPPIFNDNLKYKLKKQNTQPQKVRFITKKLFTILRRQLKFIKGGKNQNGANNWFNRIDSFNFYD